MRTFRVAFTGDFLDENGGLAYGDAGLDALDAAPYLERRFLLDLAPTPGDPSYWSRFYSLQLQPEHLRGVDGLVVLRPGLPREAFADGAGDLTVIGRSGAGFDKIDLDACTAHGVAVFNVPRALDHSTASTALLFLLALAKRLKEQEAITRAGRWDRQASVLGNEIRGRTLGIVGLGNSGRELARLVAPFAMRLIAYSPHAEPAQADALGVRLTTLDEVLASADFVSLHCRLTAATRGLIGDAELRRMKPTAYLVNVARGEVVDQAALVAVLRSRTIAGAALDVFEIEPLPADDPLLGLDNVILTPHWSASTSDIWRATGAATAAGMLRAARGEIPDNVVNPDVLNRADFRARLARFEANAGAS